MRKFTHFSFATAAIAALAIAGCSGGGGEAEPEETTAATPAAPAAPAATPAAAPVAYATLTGNAANGEKVFVQCKTCHVTDAGQNRVGPSLHTLIGRTAGQVPGFSYSAANKASGLVWTEENLFTYLEAPQKVIPGTKMAFAGLKKPQDRADVIAFLKTKM